MMLCQFALTVHQLEGDILQCMHYITATGLPSDFNWELSHVLDRIM